MKTIKVYTYRDIPENYTGVVDYISGMKEWHMDGKLHREDGPAYEGINGHKEWRINGLLHRENGPAVEEADGKIYYWYNNKPLDKDKIEQLINLGYPIKIAIKLASI